jgi:hypothetical protein
MEYAIRLYLLAAWAYVKRRWFVHVAMIAYTGAVFFGGASHGVNKAHEIIHVDNDMVHVCEVYLEWDKEQHQ